MARISTYLNFPGNAESAFNFYKLAFKSEFINGIQRFGDLPTDPSQPPLAENLRKLVLHIELPIAGGHVLMATDAVKEMGFAFEGGNNMHIQIEPDSKEEADRLFTELSANGKIETPIQEMPWGSYYANFTDQFGINWMINFKSN